MIWVQQIGLEELSVKLCRSGTPDDDNLNSLLGKLAEDVSPQETCRPCQKNFHKE